MPSRLFATVYDRLLQGMEQSHFARARQYLLPNVQGDILEIGAGTGANLPYYPPTVPSGEGPQAGKRVFLEYNPWMLKKALEKSMKRFGDPVLGSAGELPFRDRSFDTVLITLVLCSVQNLEASAREVERVLKPGGRLLILEHVSSDSPWMFGLQKTLTPLWKHLADGCHLDRNIEQSLRQYLVPVEQKRFSLHKTPFILGIWEKQENKTAIGKGHTLPG